MTVADPSATTAAPAPAPEHPSVREFTRLAGHARLVTAAILLLFRSTIIGILVLVWPAVTEPYANALLPDQLIEAMITAAITIWCMQFLMPWHTRPIRTALLTTTAIILWVSIASLLFWDEPMSDRLAHLMRLASVITAAATVATIAARYARLLLQPINLHTPASSTPASAVPFARFCLSCATVLGDADTCPTCDRNMPRLDLRPALDRELTRMRTAWQTGLLGLRCLALLIGILILAGIAQTWASAFLYYGARLDGPLLYLPRWCFLGSLTGLGIGFLAIHRPRSLAAATAAGVTLLGLFAGIVLFTLAAAPLPYRNLPSLFWQAAAAASATAACTSLITHWLLTIIVIRFAPRASAQLMLGRTIDRPASSNAPPPPSPRTCESCGYQLEGLPATRCEKCSIVGLRCPECGHTQPANTLNARILRLLYKLHTGIRAISWLAGLGATFWLLFFWFAVLSWIPIVQLVRSINAEFCLAILFLSFITISPMRFLLLHGRRLWLISLFVALLPATVLLVCPSGMAWLVAWILIPAWLMVSFCLPYLWRLWTWTIYGSGMGGELFRWHRSPAFTHASPAQICVDPDKSLGREIPLRCSGCGNAIPTSPTSSCPTCGIHSLSCPTCNEPLAISAVRLGFESILHRLRLAGLALLAIVAASVAVILVFADFINGGSMLTLVWFPQAYGRAHLSNTIESGIICAAFFGILGRMTLIRRPPVVSAVIIALLHTFWFAIVPLAFRSGYGEPATPAQIASRFIIVLLGSCILAFTAALLTRPLLRLAMYLVSPDLRQPLYLWLTGKLTLNQAGQYLS